MERLAGLGGEPISLLTYALFDTRQWTMSAEFGALVEDSQTREVHAMVRMRVGDRSLDNTHHVVNDPGEGLRRRRSIRWVSIPPEAEPELALRLVEEATDAVYGRVTADLGSVRAAKTLATAPLDPSPDLTEETPEIAVPPIPVFEFDAEPWRDRLRRASAVFARHPELLGGSAWLRATDEIRLITTSEGTAVQQPSRAVFLGLRAWARADDGQNVSLQWDDYAPDGTSGPGEEVLLAQAEELAQRVIALRTAPSADVYVGPMLLAGRAAGVAFHEVLGHPIEGQRQRAEDQAQTFRKKVGERILPESMSVIFDPGLRTLAGRALSGSYTYDDEGVRAQRVLAVENGVLRSFLLSRLPIAGFPRSNGHGRAQASYLPVARQSNLVVQTSNPVSDADLRARLVELARQRGLAYGLYVANVERGASRTGRGEPNAFNVVPVEVYQIWVDGRPDTLVRGAEVVGTPLAALGKIVAVGDRVGTFNGVCGAESGAVPVSASSPALLFEEVEVQRAVKSTVPPPALPAPTPPLAKSGQS